MPRYNVQNPDTGLWACFSGISDEFITDWMLKDEYEAWRRKQYGEGVEPAEACNMMDFDEAMQIALLEKYYQGEIAPVAHAHWVEDDDGVHCSRCKKDAALEVFTYSFHPTTDSWDGDVKFNKSEFCPHCGAKMDETEVEE